jgi:hypothetical protein
VPANCVVPLDVTTLYCTARGLRSADLEPTTEYILMPPQGPRNGIDYGWDDVDDMLDEIEELSEDMLQLVRRMRKVDSVQKHQL